VIVGMFNFLAANLLFFILWSLLKETLTYAVISLLSVVMSILLSVYTQNKFTFKSENFSGRQLLKFFTFQFLFYLLGLLLVPFITNLFNFYLPLVQLFYSVIVVMTVYLFQSNESVYDFERVSCPICQNEVEKEILRIKFLDTGLPQEYSTRYCEICEFGFSRPKNLSDGILQNYYSINSNDHSGEFLDKNKTKKQVELISSVVNLSEKSRILDFGCGQGSLLTSFSDQFGISKENLVGVDLFKSNNDSKFTHLKDLSEVDGDLFDLVVLSHTLEHLIDFEIINSLQRIIATTGYIYIEVPDSTSYHKFPRKSLFYYFDRLHINHFSLHSMMVLAKKYHLQLSSFFRHSFLYSDGHSYPALSVFLKKDSLFAALKNSVESDFSRMEQIKSELRGEKVIIWGLGDNFARLEFLGLFTESKIVGASDKKLNGSMWKGSLKVQEIEEVLSLHTDALIVITISWNPEEATLLVRNGNKHRKFLFV
jgi:SAM-dependent methyltransferase